MGVPMVQVRIMRMFVPQRLVAVPVGMRFSDFTFMGVSMMSIMHMAVLMF